MSKNKQFGIHWFRRDLRVAGNEALLENFKATDGHTVGVFCFDKAFLSRDDFSVNRFQFFINTMQKLKEELNNLGSDLLVLDVGPQKAFPELFKAMGYEPSCISFNRDYEPFAVKRDAEMKELFLEQGIDVITKRDHLLIEPHELTKPKPKSKMDEAYKVYTPFSRTWLSLYAQPEIFKRVKNQKSGFEYIEKVKANRVEKIFKLQWKDILSSAKDLDVFQQYKDENQNKVTIKIPEAGTQEAIRLLEEFSPKANDYNDNRDFPRLKATSRLSMFLKNGSITVPQIIYYLKLKGYIKKESGRDVFLSELIWREFYYHVLARFPNVEKEAFIEKYKDLKWENNTDYFKSWKEGMTGFPIVDAGMRELKQTGWMHNRVRMIVASFLTKDLLIDWKWGEKYFMEALLDGDLAPNNGGWQWAASTGCDPQPYFRIFNPWLQSKRFDPDGEYITKYIPELKAYDIKKLHEPILGHADYPEPIVDHKTQKDKALAMYKACRA